METRFYFVSIFWGSDHIWLGIFLIFNLIYGILVRVNTNIKIMAERESFHTNIQELKRASLNNLPNESDNSPEKAVFEIKTVQDFFKGKDINPETIATLFKTSRKSWDHLQWMFPQLNFEKNSEKIIAEIREMGEPKGFKTPGELLAAIAVYIKKNMSYDLLTVLFTNPWNEEYTNILRKTLDNPNAKFDISSEQIAQLQYFALNLSTNSGFSRRESDMIKEMSRKSWDIRWLRDQVMNNSQFRNLLEKIGKQNGDRLYSTEAGGILRTNENASRDISTMLNTVKVWVCRDFAMMSKKIYEKMSKDTFPNSEAIYVSNLKSQHAYILLAYEKPDGTIEKRYFDPTAYITGWPLQVERNSTYGNEKNEILVKNEEKNNPVIV